VAGRGGEALANVTKSFIVCKRKDSGQIVRKKRSGDRQDRFLSKEGLWGKGISWGRGAVRRG